MAAPLAPVGAGAGKAADHSVALHRAFLVGERFTVADISLYAYTHVAAEGDSTWRGIPPSGRGSVVSPGGQATHDHGLSITEPAERTSASGVSTP